MVDACPRERLTGAVPTTALQFATERKRGQGATHPRVTPQRLLASHVLNSVRVRFIDHTVERRLFKVRMGSFLPARTLVAVRRKGAKKTASGNEGSVMRLERPLDLACEKRVGRAGSYLPASMSRSEKSVARQVGHARDYASRKGWTVDDASVFVDDGISGAEFANRPGFLRLMNAVKPRAPFQVLVMSEESRLGHDPTDLSTRHLRHLWAGPWTVTSRSISSRGCRVAGCAAGR
jgi:hypothetical protein